MADSRRSDDLQKELSTLWKTAVASFDDLRDTVLRGGQAGKATLDVTLQKRQRDRLLLQLGEVVLAEAEQGSPLPAACQDLVERIRLLDVEIKEGKATAERAWRGTETRPGLDDADEE